MKIRINALNKKTFAQLSDGEVFLFDGTAYMKTETILSNDNIEYNAVNLSDGTLEPFTTDSVTPLKNAVLITE